MQPKLKLLALSASLLACGVAVSGNAHANAYALATDNISDGFVFIGIDTDGNGSPDTLAPTVITVTSLPSSISSTSATLGGTGTTGSSITPPPDAPASNGTGSNPVRTNEDTMVSAGLNTYYDPFGQLATNYSWADAKIVSEQSALGTPIVARGAAETNISVSGFGDGNSTNSSSTTVIAFDIANPDCATLTCAISFSFKADPYIYTELDAAAAGTVARGTLSFSITISQLLDPTNPSLGSTTIFAWAPNGTTGGIFGGTEVLDGDNLNLTKESLIPGQINEHSGPYANDVFASFNAYTSRLGLGSYTLTIAMKQSTDATRVVPEPASLALLGLGLVGMGLARRRKQA